MDHLLETSAYALSATSENTKRTSAQLGLIGANQAADKVRIQSQALDNTLSNTYIKDLGNVAPDARSDFYDSVSELAEYEHITPVIIANNEQYSELLNQLKSDMWTPAYVDRSINRYIDLTTPYTIIAGVQLHHGLNDQQLDSDKVIRLSEVRYNHNKAEALLRNIDTAFIHIDAIRYSDNMGHRGSWPAGLTIEEMCQICKYIGASTQLKSVVIGGYHENEDDKDNIIARNISLMLYYLTEGYAITQREIVSGQASFNSYTVLPDGFDMVLTFRENQQTGRWWIEHEFEGESRLIPCTKEDYEEACCNKISDTITKLYSYI